MNKVQKALYDLGLREWMTGGNCTAFGYDLTDGGARHSDLDHLMVTEADEACSPEDDDAVCVGIYGKAEEGHYFTFANPSDAVDFVRLAIKGAEFSS